MNSVLEGCLGKAYKAQILSKIKNCLQNVKHGG